MPACSWEPEGEQSRSGCGRCGCGGASWAGRRVVRRFVTYRPRADRVSADWSKLRRCNACNAGNAGDQKTCVQCGSNDLGKAIGSADLDEERRQFIEEAKKLPRRPPVVVDEVTRAKWPKTVEEAVSRLLSVVSEDNGERFRRTPKEELTTFRHGWGVGIRNDYGLWQGNESLLDDCHADDPDDASRCSSSRDTFAWPESPCATGAVHPLSGPQSSTAFYSGTRQPATPPYSTCCWGVSASRPLSCLMAGKGGSSRSVPSFSVRQSWCTS